MWHFLAREANWTEIVTNTLAMGFSLMAIVVIAYSVMVRPEILTAVGSVTSGITGVILGYYFNRERLRRAQQDTRQAEAERSVASTQAAQSIARLERVSDQYRVFMIEYEELLNEQNREDPE